MMRFNGPRLIRHERMFSNQITSFVELDLRPAIGQKLNSTSGFQFHVVLSLCNPPPLEIDRSDQ
jgi:hypothetical protein